MRRRAFLMTAGATMVTQVFPRMTLAAADPGRIVLDIAPARAPLMGAGSPATSVWAFRGSVPGPVLRLKQGREVSIVVNNGLTQPTSVHWHGLRIDNAMDGVSGLTQEPIAPGSSFEYTFVPPDAGTYWYHSHHRSWEQVAMGLYGAMIVEEADPVPVDRDVLFVADDWRLGEDGQITRDFGHMRDASHAGRLGNWLTINGTSKPSFPARPGERMRLRCVCAANARVMAFDFSALSPQLVALDGQPLEAPQATGRALWLAPGQRADLIVDIPADAAGSFAVQEVSTRDAVVAATIVVSGAPVSRPGAKELRLPANPLPASLDLTAAVRTDLLMEGGAMGGMAGARHMGRMFDMRTLAMEKGLMWSFNGQAGKSDEPLLRLAVGQTAVIDMVNDTRWPHAMHLHGHHFQVVGKNGTDVSVAPWRDTELMQPGDRVSIAFVADNPGKWLFHCHMLEHHKAGMGTWIEVV